MSHILFLTQVLPYPLDAGPKVRAYHMLRHLAERHRVSLVSFVRGDDTPEAVAHLRGICETVHAVPMRRSTWRNVRAGARGLLTGLPVVVVRDEIAEMAAKLRGLASTTAFDVVHADQLSMAGYGQLAARAIEAVGPRRPRTLLDEHNAIYLLTERMAGAERQPLRKLIMQREARAFRRYEARMCRAYDAVLTVTEEDRGHLLQLGAGDKFTVVPICVDPARTPAIPRVAGGPPAILHLGTMFWPPNVAGVLWFAPRCCP